MVEVVTAADVLCCSCVRAGVFIPRNLSWKAGACPLA